MARGVGGTSPVNVAQYLSGIDFPCQKEDLLAHAEHNGAEEEVLQVLQDIPEGEYHNMADVMKGYGEARDKQSANAGADDKHGSRAQHTKAGSQSHDNR